MKAFRRIYPPSGRQLLDGGKNNKFERSIIQDNESPDCLNVVFSNGSVGTREGITKLNATSIGSYVCDGLYTRRSNTGAETMIVFGGGSAWQLGGSTFTVIASAQSVFTAGVRIGATNYENHLFAGNGGVIPYKWNGTAWTRHGVYPPTTTATVASQAVGALTGDYRYKVTFVNSQAVESDVSPVTTTFPAAGATLRVSNIPTAPQSYGIGSRYLYRTVAGGSVFKRLTEIADNTTTTYDDVIADAALGTNAPSDNGVPPKYSVVLYHQNRLFMNDPENPNLVVYTNLGEPYTVAAASNFIPIGDASGDLVKTLSVYDNSVLVGCEKSQWLIYMSSTDPTEWQTIRMKSPYGSKSPYCFIDYNNKQLFPATESGEFVGFAAVSGDGVDPSATLLTVSSAGSNLKSDRIEPDMFLVQKTYVPNISGIVFKNKAWIALTYGSGSTMNNRVYQLDFSASNLSKTQTEAWVPFTGWSPAQFTIYDGKLYFGSATATGFVYQCESGTYGDDGAAINSYFRTKEFSGYDEDTNFQKDFRLLNLLVDKAGAYYMSVTARVDSDTGEGDSYQVNLDPGGSLWGVMVWGTDMWGGGTAQENITLSLGTLRGKRIQYKFSNQNTLNQRFKVHYMNFTYNLKGQR